MSSTEHVEVTCDQNSRKIKKIKKWFAIIHRREYMSRSLLTKTAERSRRIRNEIFLPSSIEQRTCQDHLWQKQQKDEADEKWNPAIIQRKKIKLPQVLILCWDKVDRRQKYLQKIGILDGLKPVTVQPRVCFYKRCFNNSSLKDHC